MAVMWRDVGGDENLLVLCTGVQNSFHDVLFCRIFETLCGEGDVVDRRLMSSTCEKDLDISRPNSTVYLKQFASLAASCYDLPLTDTRHSASRRTTTPVCSRCSSGVGVSTPAMFQTNNQYDEKPPHCARVRPRGERFVPSAPYRIVI